MELSAQQFSSTCSTECSMTKNEIALAEVSNKFTSSLQYCMKDAGYDTCEREVDHPSFLHFMHFALHDSVQRLQKYLKSSLYISEEEQDWLQRLYAESTVFVNVEPTENALTLMRKELPQYLKQCMINAGFSSVEVAEDHESYSNFLKKFITFEIKELFRLKSKYEASVNDNSFSLNSENPSSSQSNSSSIILVDTTKNHYIYCDSSTNIAIKVLKSNTPHLKFIKNLDNELNIGKTVVHPAFRSSLERSTFEGKQALLLMWARGYAISYEKKFPVLEFLNVAREIVSGLLAMHMKHIMHMDLTCEHIIFNPQSKSIQIIGCSSSTTFDKTKSYISNQELLEKDLRCISPEQTGRVNRDLRIDYRSDFYSLGVIFYKMLTGTYPFECESPFKLLHLHIFQEHVPICEVDPNIPVKLSEMISRLMEKNAKDRYQSTRGIIHDLDLMISEYSCDKTLSSIVLVQHDIPEKLFISQQLYGCSTQCSILRDTFKKVFQESSFELVLISGDSGTGKSSLVYELRKPIAQHDGIFIRGKFDFSKTEPYSAILESLRNFCDDLLLMDESTITNYKSKIQHAVGDKGKILTDVINNLHLIIGEQPEISDDVFVQGAKNRFNVFINFIQAICSMESPVVLVLDDLQWADMESLSLLSDLLKGKSIKNLMIIGTYRQNEVSKHHQLALLIEDAKGLDTNLKQIKLDNLDHATLNELISDALCVSSLESYALTAMIYEKTNGNPYFVKQMLLSLFEEDVIFFSNVTSKWSWNAAIFAEDDNISRNILDLIRRRISILPQYAQQALKVASCLGSQFSLSTIKLIINSSQGVEDVLATGMIVQSKGSETIYTFGHDHIQQAAFSLLPTDTRSMFLYIGKKLWKTFSANELNENIFTVAHLLYQAKEILDDEAERVQIAALFMHAGAKALSSTAFEQAIKYFDAAIDLLGDGGWNTHYELSLKVHNATAKALYCIADYTKMNLIINDIIENAASTLELVPSYLLRIKHYNDEHKFEDAIITALCILDKIGECINLTQSESITSSEIQKIKVLMNSLSDRQLSEMPTLSHKGLLSVMMILSGIIYSLYYSNPQLRCLASLRMVQISLKHGLCKYAAIGFCALGSVLCSRDDVAGYQLGQAAIVLLDKVKAKEVKSWVFIVFYGTISPFYTSIHYSLDPILKIYITSLGLHETSSICSATYVMYAFLSGMPLQKLLSYLEDIKEGPVKYKTILCINEAVHNLIDWNAQRNPARVSGELYDFKLCLDKDEKVHDKSRCSLICCMIAYAFYDYSLALQFVEVCRSLDNYLKGFYMYPIFLLYSGLVSLEHARSAMEKDEWIKDAKENIAKLRNMAKDSPANYLNKVHLLEAELAVVNRNTPEAVSHYQKAILWSNKNGFLHEEAMACERAGIFFLEIYSSNDARESLSQSYTCYEKWGANAKMVQLRTIYPFLCKRRKKGSSIDAELQLESINLSTVSTLTEISKKEKKKLKTSFT